MTAEGLLPKLPDPIEVWAECLRRVLVDMDANIGWYPSAQLYTWYAGMCAEDGGTPVSAKRFGLVLRELGYLPSTRRHAGRHTRGWMITRRAFQGLPPREAGA